MAGGGNNVLASELEFALNCQRRILSKQRALAGDTQSIVRLGFVCFLSNSFWWSSLLLL